MARVWVGYSNVLGFKDLIKEYIDPYSVPVDEDEDEEEPVGRLTSEFGASDIRPGDFEVYERKSESEADFDYAGILTRFPFDQKPANLANVDWPKITCVFYVKSDGVPHKHQDENIIVTDCLDVKFDWE